MRHPIPPSSPAPPTDESEPVLFNITVAASYTIRCTIRYTIVITTCNCTCTRTTTTLTIAVSSPTSSQPSYLRHAMMTSLWSCLRALDRRQGSRPQTSAHMVTCSARPPFRSRPWPSACRSPHACSMQHARLTTHTRLSDNPCMPSRACPLDPRTTMRNATQRDPGHAVSVLEPARDGSSLVAQHLPSRPPPAEYIPALFDLSISAERAHVTKRPPPLCTSDTTLARPVQPAYGSLRYEIFTPASLAGGKRPCSPPAALVPGSWVLSPPILHTICSMRTTTSQLLRSF